MTAKQLIIIILIASFSLTFIIIAIVGVYKYDPAMLGYPTDKKDTVIIDTILFEPKVLISEKKLSKLEYGLVEKATLKNQKDSVIQEQKRLLDSLQKVFNMIAFYKDSVSKVKKDLGATGNTVQFLQDSLMKVYSELQAAIEKNKAAQRRVEDHEKFLAKKIDTLEKQNFEDFAKLYNNANPKDVAKILEQIDERDAAKILKMMQKKKAGKIIEAMLPERAAAILLLGAGE